MDKSKPTQSRQRILVVDDHPMTREGITLRIRVEPDLDVSGEVDSASAAIAAMQEDPPDLVVSDLSLGGRSGLELIKELHVLYPHVPVLVFSMHYETLYAERALRAGARGYLMKGDGAEKLIQAIRHVLRGGVYLSAVMLDYAMHQFAGGPSAAHGDNSAALSDRELEVFELMGKGLGTRQISEQLQVSVSTVTTRRVHIMKKLRLKTIAGLKRAAAKWVSGQPG